MVEFGHSEDQEKWFKIWFGNFGHNMRVGSTVFLHHPGHGHQVAQRRLCATSDHPVSGQVGNLFYPPHRFSLEGDYKLVNTKKPSLYLLMHNPNQIELYEPYYINRA